MNEDTELADLVRTQIEEPAGRRLLQLAQEGAIQEVDVKLFQISAQRYKNAMFAQYESFDPVVRHELVRSLITDYQATIDEMLAGISRRGKPSQGHDMIERAGDVREGESPTEGWPDGKTESRSEGTPRSWLGNLLRRRERRVDDLPEQNPDPSDLR